MPRYEDLSPAFFGTPAIGLSITKDVTKFGGRNLMKKGNSTGYICLDTYLCQACWKCIEACPSNVIGKIKILFHRHAHIKHPENCKGCLSCTEACPQGAILPSIPAKCSNYGVIK